MELVRYQPLTPEHSEALARRLDLLLGEYAAFRDGVVQIHRTPELRPYLELTEKVGRLYGAAQFGEHQLAERIISLGYRPGSLGSDPDGLPAEHGSTADFQQAVFALIHSARHLLEEVRQAYLLAAEYDEKRSMALLNQLAAHLVIAIGAFAALRLSTLN
jgi:DNA-binding ferritin-like protein